MAEQQAGSIEVRSPAVRRVVPVLTVDSIDASRITFEAVLGLHVVMDHGWIVTMADAVHPTGAQISLITRDATAVLNPELSVEVDDVDLAYRAANAAGSAIVHEIRDEPWGVRRFFLRDESGRVTNVLSHRTARTGAALDSQGEAPDD